MWPWIYWKSEILLMGRLREFRNLLPKRNLKIEWPPVGGWRGMWLEVFQRKEHSPSSMSFLSDTAKVRGRESIWPPSHRPFSSVVSELWFSSELCQNHSTVYVLESRAPRTSRIFGNGHLSHIPLPMATLRYAPFLLHLLFWLFCLSLVVYTWSSEQDVLEPGQGC